MKPTVIDIVGTIRELVKGVLKQILLIAGLALAAAIAPVILVVIPQVLIIQNPHGDFRWLEQLFFWATPLMVALWMMALCHFHGIRQWQRAGKLSTYSEDHGGFWLTNLKSTGFLVLGFFGSFVCEALFSKAFKYVVPFVPVHYYGPPEPYNVFSSLAIRHSLWFALFPFAAFAPVIWLLIKRRNYFESEYPDMENWSEARRMRSPYLYYTPDERRVKLAEERAAWGRASREDLKLIAAADEQARVKRNTHEMRGLLALIERR